MSKFKIGDQVHIIDKGSRAYCLIGEVISFFTLNGRNAYIVKYENPNVQGVYSTESFFEDYLTYPNQTSQTQVHTDEMARLASEISKELKTHDNPVKCDCGGFKTYGSMSPESHSNWCSSRGNN